MDSSTKLIEYSKTNDGWKPHSVIKGNSGFDFDWCESYGMLCFHESGIGGYQTGSIGRFVDAPKVCSKIWIADGYKVFHDKTEIVTKSQFRELGYQKIDFPLEINGSIDPFEYADADEPTEYCKFCDRVPSNDACNHLAYDEWYGGFLFGCGSLDLSFERTKASLFRLLRFLSPKQLEKLYRQPYSSCLFEWRDFEYDYRKENQYIAGIEWLASLDSKTKGPNTLTSGWIYEYREIHENRIASPSSSLWLEMPKKTIDKFLSLDVEYQVDEKITLKFPRKVKSAHDKFFNDSPNLVTEVILKPRTKKWQSERVMNIAVGDVEVSKGKATLSFSYFIKQGESAGKTF